MEEDIYILNAHGRTSLPATMFLLPDNISVSFLAHPGTYLMTPYFNPDFLYFDNDELDKFKSRGVIKLMDNTYKEILDYNLKIWCPSTMISFSPYLTHPNVISKYVQFSKAGFFKLPLFNKDTSYPSFPKMTKISAPYGVSIIPVNKYYLEYDDNKYTRYQYSLGTDINTLFRIAEKNRSSPENVEFVDFCLDGSSFLDILMLPQFREHVYNGDKIELRDLLYAISDKYPDKKIHIILANCRWFGPDNTNTVYSAPDKSLCDLPGVLPITCNKDLLTRTTSITNNYEALEQLLDFVKFMTILILKLNGYNSPELIHPEVDKFLGDREIRQVDLPDFNTTIDLLGYVEEELLYIKNRDLPVINKIYLQKLCNIINIYEKLRLEINPAYNNDFFHNLQNRCSTEPLKQIGIKTKSPNLL
jgi:hypothetical protein